MAESDRRQAQESFDKDPQTQMRTGPGNYQSVIDHNAEVERLRRLREQSQQG